MGSFTDYFRNMLDLDSARGRQDSIPDNLPVKQEGEMVHKERPPMTFDHGSCELGTS